MNEDNFFSILRRYPRQAHEMKTTENELRCSKEFRKIIEIDEMYLKHFKRYPDAEAFSAYSKMPLEQIDRILSKENDKVVTNDDTVFREFIKSHENIDVEMNLDGVFTAVIIETRNNPLLRGVLKNMGKYIDKGLWRMVLYHGSHNSELAKSVQYEIKGLELKELEIEETMTIAEYNSLLSSIQFWDTIKTKKCLVFQCDSCLLRRGIESFMDYDYIGAPWSNKKVGNGGFSVRDVEKMQYIIKNFERPYWENEDLYFSRHAYNLNLNLPTFEIARTFCCESQYTGDHIATHQGWRFLKEPRNVFKP
jgi:hypothetical protein